MLEPHSMKIAQKEIFGVLSIIPFNLKGEGYGSEKVVSKPVYGHGIVR